MICPTCECFLNPDGRCPFCRPRTVAEANADLVACPACAAKDAEIARLEAALKEAEDLASWRQGQILRLEAALAAAQQEPWIPLAQQLPRSGQQVLAWHDGRAEVLRYWRSAGRDWWDPVVGGRLTGVECWREVAAVEEGE